MEYFSIEPTETESALIQYIIRKVDEETGDKSSKVRYQKIVVDVANKLNLPITRFWYKMGEICPLKCELNPIYTDSRILKIIRSDLSDHPNIIKEIDQAIGESCDYYKKSDSTERLRRKQYDKYSDELYQVVLDLQILFSKDIEENRKEISKLLGSMLYLVQKDKTLNYFYDSFFEFVTVTKKILLTNKEINGIALAFAFKEFVDYLANIKAKATVKGPSSHALKSAISEERLKQCSFSAKNTLLGLNAEYHIHDLPELKVDNEFEYSALLSVHEIVDSEL